MKSRVALISLATIAFATQATVKTMTDEDDDDDKKIIKVEPENNHKEQQELQEQQNNTLPPPPIVPDIPTSPQAQAFSRLGDYGMNNSSGVPNISIPLFEIDHFGYTIPLTLCYEAQPLRPGYNYDVFGLGWSLSGNSCVSRTIHDRADEDGLFGTPFKLDSFSEHNGNPKLYKNWADKLGEVNYEYDSYNITLPSGRNIPFFMYMEGTQMKYDLMDLDSNVKIVCHYSTSLCSIDSFDVTDEDGTVYTFDIAEKASNIYLDDINAVRNVSWLLSRIDIPHKQCSLIYEYGNLIQFSAYTAMEPILTIDRMYTDVVEDDPEQKYRFYFNMQDQCCIYNMRFLQKITYGPTEVVFDYQSDGRHISTIRVNDNNSTVKKYTFALSGQYAKLSTLTITGTNTVDQQKYKFEYASINPGTKIDPWGNYGTSSANTDIGNINLFVDKGGVNVQDMTSYLSPLGNMIQRISPKPTDLQCYYKLKLQSQTSGDSRQATSPSQHGVLTRIVYPNGGSTAYTFENHRFLTATDANGDFVFARRQQRIIEGGGFRIKSIKNYKADGSLANQAEY